MSGEQHPRAHRMIASTVIILSILLVLAAAAYAVQAGQAESLVISPSKVELTVQRGVSTTFTIDVANSSEVTMAVLVNAVDFARDESGNIRLIAPEDSKTFRGCSQWVEMPFAQSTTIEPSSTVTLGFTVNVPSDASYGTHYCYIPIAAASTKPPSDANASEGEVVVRSDFEYTMNALLLVQVGAPGGEVPTIKNALRVKSLGVKTVNFTADVPFKAAIYNAGNIHSSLAEGSGIQIWQGKTLKDTITLQQYTLLPENTIALPVVWHGKALFGKYKARFIGEVGLDKPLLAEKTFWVINPWFAGAVIVGTLVLIALLVLFFSRFRLQLAPRSTGEGS